ncbi:hypothetical protein BDV25DRAFT_135171 [Aspergillus avenaceus]|uniref:Uncharacterized protein n=1 Tax=Aspergillus avenaceus TaxID=36643 RepID=A0A5N6U944_ASPAV|nr:hypothetical protein BDV25DRAFT_135171 [Aspergillus avenaceus]
MSRDHQSNDVRRQFEGRPRMVGDRTASELDYDVRSPRTRYNPPEPSYYGPNFKDIELGRRGSCPERKDAKMPNPYVKRPNPYPYNVRKEYDDYKHWDRQYTEVRDQCTLLISRPDWMEEAGPVDSVQEEIALAQEARRTANQAAARRSGFDQKYPYAYENPQAKENHRGRVNQLLRGVRWHAQEVSVRQHLENEIAVSDDVSESSFTTRSLSPSDDAE